MAVNDEYGAVPYNGMPVVAPDIAQVAGGTLSTFNDKVRSLKSLNIIVAGKQESAKAPLSIRYSVRISQVPVSVSRLRSISRNIPRKECPWQFTIPEGLS